MRRSLVFVTALAALAACAPDPLSVTNPPPAPPPPPGSSISRWSDAATWAPAGIPTPGSDITIPAGKTIQLDVSPPALNRLTINGTLVAGDTDLALTAHEIYVNGLLRVGSETAHFAHQFTVTLTGGDSGSASPMVGSKVLAVFSGGSLELHGDTRAGWTQLAATASAGATTLNLSQPMNWHVGDRIVISSTDYDPGQAEEAVITAAAPTVVGLQMPLMHSHWGLLQTIAGREVDERAQVGLLTRNVTIEGDAASSGGYGGHVIVLRGGTAHVEGVQFTRMGQSGKVARYPMHWHMAGDVSGQYLRDASIWKTNNRCVTVHGSDNATVQRNVCYDHLGHGYFLEDGSESGNTIEGNLGLISRAPAAAIRILPSDATPATFWITNPANTIRNNVAAGSVAFGFWFALPAAPTGFSTGQPDAPRLTPLGTFIGNSAHSNRQPGLQVDNGPRADLTTETTSYTPRAGAVASGAPVIGYFQNFSGWKHSGRAVWIRGQGLRLVDAVLADNAQGATFANGDIILQNSLIVGESANLTTPPNPSYPIRGFEFYDGTNGATAVTFANFVSRAGRIASAIGYNRSDGFPVSQANFVSAITLVNANAVYFDNPAPTKDGDKASLFVDADGSVTGTAGMSVVANNPFLVTPACSYRSDWNTWLCPQRYAGLSIQSDAGESVSPVSLQRDDGASVSLAGVPNNPQSAQISVLPARSYQFTWSGTAPLRPRITLQRAVAGDWVRVSIPYGTASFNVLRDFSSTPLAPAASAADVDAAAGDRYYWDAATQRIEAKMLVRAGRTSTTLQVVAR